MTQPLITHIYPSGQRLEITQGDLLAEPVDAIVNAANEQLAHGGGIAEAIVRRGGYSIQQESHAWVRKHGPVTHDSPAYTGPGSLPCRYIIHAVGPVWYGGKDNEDDKLAAAVQGSLRLADELRLGSIAFPAISTGIFHYPVERAAAVIFKSIAAYFVAQPASGVTLVRLVLWNDATWHAFSSAWEQVAAA